MIDDEARERLTPLLAARRLAEWVGGGGWARDATSLGRTTELTDLPPGMTADEVRARRRQVLPLAEFRVPFTVLRSEIDDIQRGARDPELDDLARAARLAAEFENRAVFHGWPAADIVGIAAACPYPTIALGLDCAQYPGIVARAVDTLRRNGIEGPYALAIGPAGYTRIVETTEHGGYLLIDHLTGCWAGGAVGTRGWTARSSSASAAGTSARTSARTWPSAPTGTTPIGCTSTSRSLHSASSSRTPRWRDLIGPSRGRPVPRSLVRHLQQPQQRHQPQPADDVAATAGQSTSSQSR